MAPRSAGRPARGRLPWRAAAVAALAATLTACGGASESERDRAVTAALQAYGDARAALGSLARGPCIAERLPGLPDWVADIAHEPRKPVDDRPRNQCRRYRAGEAHHFVGLTPGGEVIRVQ